MNKDKYTTYELAALLKTQHSNVKTCLKRLIDNSESWVMTSNVEYVRDGVKSYYILSKEDFIKVIFKLRPQLAHFLYVNNVML